jgi:hypothetical protein
MRLSTLVAVVLGTSLVAGCASTVSPLYTKSDVVTDPTLVGTWVSNDPNNQSTVRIEKEKEGSYQVSVHDPKSGDDSIYDAHLVKLGAVSFADLLLTNYRHDGKNVDLPAGAVPLHEIVKYQIAGNDLSVSSIDGDALDKAAKQAGFSLQLRDTATSNGSTVILSTTPELRRHFSAHPAQIFGEVDHLTRQH